MLLTVYTLPQLAVSAKLLCLLMVVICGAVPSMVRSVRLYNDCSCRYVGIDMKGRVLAADDDESMSRFQNLTIRSLDYNVTLTIYGEASGRWLCFNKKWKPVGLKRFNKKMCLFYEEMLTSGYTRFRSASQSHFVGFNRNGKPLRGSAAKPKPNSKKEKCFNFVKNDTNFNIGDHNYKIAGGNHSAANPAYSQHFKDRIKQQRGKGRNKKPPTDHVRFRHNRNKMRLS